jgi:hypothetical protein
MPPLRASQVETLRLVAEYGNGIEFEPWKLAADRECSEAEAEVMLCELSATGHLARRMDTFSRIVTVKYRLTQLGHEALEGSDG